MRGPWYLTHQKFSRHDGIALEGTLPAIKAGDCEVLVCSLGAPKEECEDLAHRIHAILNVMHQTEERK